MVNESRDEESGQYTEKYPSSAFVEALDDVGTATTADVADAVGCDQDTAYRRLRTLAEEGRIEQQKVGNSLLWSPSGRGL